MKLTDYENSLLAGEAGPARQWAIRHQMQVGAFFDAEDFAEVGQAHVMADTESLGESGVQWLEKFAELPEKQRRVVIPTITDPRGLDFDTYKRLKQTERMNELEARTIRAFEALGVLMTNTCINYQTVLPPVRGEHLAFGDTGVVIYSNGVFGARSNFEGGPSAIAAGLTGRTPRYGYHLDENRIGTHSFKLEAQPRDLAEWGALGAIVGRRTGNYWSVPVIDGVETPPNSDALKHFGAAAASYGSIAMFHMPGVTPEAANTKEAFGGKAPPAATPITLKDIEAVAEGYGGKGDALDVVVFAAPQLSLLEMEAVAGMLGGRTINPRTTVIVATSPEIKFASDRMGLTKKIEQSGAIVTSGVCFYQSYAREMAEANGWKRLMSNSAKLVNIIGGYGYSPSLASMERCIDSAVAGKVI